MFRAALALVSATAVLAACAQPKALSVSDAWVRLAAVDGRPAAGYFTISGGPADATLIGVTSDVAVWTELHESKPAAGGGMTMDAIRSVAVPALQSVSFVPGGKHLMLFDVNPAVKPGATIPLTFTFADGTRIEHKARVIAAGDPPPFK